MFKTLATAATTALLMLGGAAVPAVAAAPAAPVTYRAAADTPSEIDVTSANYQQVVEYSKTKPVVLDFTATWCSWCQKQKPYLAQYNKDDKGAWIWARVDADTNRDLVRKFKVSGLPTLVNLRNGAEAGSRMEGWDGARALRTWLNNL
ncbi:thioredoxin family protein [Streptomyces sp. LP05-1]|uniref:Thioredoxin family protein n=1 Tax=Streptomyces pyxinae TaxID=2970734 RepID=A0ABT2CDE0_9ACTN|nr:thioredoxin family protein [Streptomyces sp. LP05-1]MCS0635443.1 thioredoxin family protein [Streptomyces sp. LP05-1]